MEVHDQIIEEGGSQLKDLADREIEFELRHEVREALDMLTTTQRNRVYQYFFMGLNYRDIAMREGVTSSAVSESINRALSLEMIIWDPKNPHLTVTRARRKRSRSIFKSRTLDFGERNG